VAIGDRLGAYVRKRAGFKLGKFALDITRTTVWFANVSGPKGAPTCSCKFEVVTTGSGRVVVEARAASTREAFDVAADSAEQAVRRLMEKRHRARR
jgi:ribosome-associated translation inhibitor RaiA